MVNGLYEKLIGICISVYDLKRLGFIRKTLELFNENIKNNRFKLAIVIDKQSKIENHIFTCLEVLNLDQFVKIIRSNDIGLSNARSSGIKFLTKLQCDWIFFIDDDAIPDVSWIDTVQHIISRVPSNIGLLTGNTVPFSANQSDFILPPPLFWIWGCTFPPIYRNKRSIVRNPIGANMGIKTNLFNKIKFSTSFGRLGNNYAGCEETDFALKALRFNYNTLYVPDLLVKHYVPSSRNQISYIIRRCYYEGQSKQLLTKKFGKKILTSESNYPNYLLIYGIKNPRYLVIIIISIMFVIFGYFGSVRKNSM